MFMPVLESITKITTATVDAQQEMFNKWFSIWPGFQGMAGKQPGWQEQIQRIQKQWSGFIRDLVKQQVETVEAQFKIGQQNIEKAFQVGEIKNPEELRARTQELWQECFVAVRQASEAQMKCFSAAIEKWLELVNPPPTS